MQLGLAGAAEDVAQLVADELLDVGTGGLQVLTRVELVGMLVEELTDGAGHGKTQVGVDVDLADGQFRCMTELLFGNTNCIGHLAAVFVDHLHILLRNGGRAVQHDREAGQTLGDLFEDVEAQGRRNEDALFVAGALISRELVSAIHSRGCGYAELDPDYAYPMVDSLDKDGNRINGYTGQSRKDWAYLNLAAEQARVDSMIINENALETCFEGKRFYDLIRFAKRYHNNAWVADPVSKREGKENRDGALYNKLMLENNWFLNWKGQIGM